MNIRHFFSVVLVLLAALLPEISSAQCFQNIETGKRYYVANEGVVDKDAAKDCWGDETQSDIINSTVVCSNTGTGISSWTDGSKDQLAQSFADESTAAIGGGPEVTLCGSLTFVQLPTTYVWSDRGFGVETREIMQCSIGFAYIPCKVEP